MDDPGGRFARHLVGTVLERLRRDGAPEWRVSSVREAVDDLPPPPGCTDATHLLVTVRTSTAPGPDDDRTVGVHFTLGVPLVDAVLATAGQVQDHLIEATRGAALPRCPGHPHPLELRPEDGIATWVCPRDVRHHREPVLPPAG